MANIELYDEQQLLDCREYFALREEHTEWNMEQIASEIGISRRALYDRINKWKRTGAYQRVEQEIMQPRAAAVESAIAQIIQKWPTVILRQLDDAVNAEKASDRRQAAKFLSYNVVNPYFDKKRAEGSDEMKYVQSDPSFMPTDIPAIEDVVDGDFSDD